MYVRLVAAEAFLSAAINFVKRIIKTNTTHYERKKVKKIHRET